MAEGQELGPKATYIYRTDSDDDYVILRDTTLAMSNITGLYLYTEGAPDLDNLPRGIKPRGVHWIGYDGVRLIRKFIICGLRDSPLYIVKGSSPITIDGTRGYTTGKRGEQKRMPRRSAAVPVNP